MDEQLLNSKESAELIDLAGKFTIFNALINAGYLTPIYIGKTVLYNKKEVERLKGLNYSALLLIKSHEEFDKEHLKWKTRILGL